MSSSVNKPLTELLDADWREKLEALIESWDRLEDLKWQLGAYFDADDVREFGRRVNISRRLYFERFRQLPLIELDTLAAAGADVPAENQARLEEFRQMRDFLKTEGPMGPTPLLDQVAEWEVERTWNDFQPGFAEDAIASTREHCRASRTSTDSAPAPAKASPQESRTVCRTNGESVEANSRPTGPPQHPVAPAPMVDKERPRSEPPADHRPPEPDVVRRSQPKETTSKERPIPARVRIPARTPPAWNTAIAFGVPELDSTGSGCGGDAAMLTYFQDVEINGWSRETNSAWRDEQTGGDSSETVNADRSETVAGDLTVQTVGHQSVTVQKILDVTVGTENAPKTHVSTFQDPTYVNLANSPLSTMLTNVGQSSLDPLAFANISENEYGTIPDAVYNSTIQGEQYAQFHDNVTENIQGNVAGQIAGNLTSTTKADSVSGSDTGNRTLTFKGNQSVNIGGDYNINVGGDFHENLTLKQKITASGLSSTSSSEKTSSNQSNTYYYGIYESAAVAATEQLSAVGAFEMVEAAGEFKIKSPMQSLWIVFGIATLSFKLNWTLDLNILVTETKALDLRAENLKIKFHVSNEDIYATKIDSKGIETELGIVAHM